MAVEKVNHIAILVKDLEGAAKDYSDLLGIEFSGPNEIENLDLRSMPSPVGIELVSPLTPDGATARTLERRGEGVLLVALRVADLQEKGAQLKAKGLRQVAGDGVRTIILHPKDFHGVMFELIQPDS